jgi:hypothetical protein
VAHPANGTLYLKLRDDPATVQTLTLPITPANQGSQASSPAPAAEATPASTQRAAALSLPPGEQTEKAEPSAVPKPDAKPNR